MKKWILLLWIGAVLPVLAQSTKEEKRAQKEWARKLKDTDPMDFKALTEERDALASEVGKLRQSVTEKQRSLDEATARTADLSAELTENKARALAPPAPTPGQPRTVATQPVQGLVFKVQIGAFRNQDLTAFTNHPNFGGEAAEDGTHRYTLGAFTDYWQADTFKKYLRQMGVKDAWVVAYRHGERVAMREALENGQNVPLKPALTTATDDQ